MTRKYSHCFHCGGEVEEQVMPRELRWKGKLFVLENVPIGVCRQCGEKFLQPEVSKKIDQILQEEPEPLRIIEVPVYEYESGMA